MIICFPLLCGCEMESEYEEEKYTISDDDDFGLSLSDYKDMIFIEAEEECSVKK